MLDFIAFLLTKLPASKSIAEPTTQTGVGALGISGTACITDTLQHGDGFSLQML